MSWGRMLRRGSLRRRMKGRTLTVSYAEPRQADMQQAQAAQAAPEAVKARPAARPARPARAAVISCTCAAVRRPAPAVLGVQAGPRRGEPRWGAARCAGHRRAGRP